MGTPALRCPCLGASQASGALQHFMVLMGPISGLSSVCWALGRLITWGSKKLGGTFPQEVLNGFSFL